MITTKSEPRYVAKTLAWVNSIRKDAGVKPLKRLMKGCSESKQYCSVRNSLNAVGCQIVNATQWVKKGHEIYPLPDYVRKFIQVCIDGRLPQYEL